jgi:hypothetical protein
MLTLPAKLVPLAALLVASNARAEGPAAPTPLDTYRAEMLETDFSVWSGIGLQKAGREVDASDALFEGSPRALEHYDAHATLMPLGFITVMAGVAGVVAGLIVWRPSAEDPDDRNAAVGVPVLVGGVALEITGSAMLGIGQKHLFDAVHDYNDDLYRRLRSGGSR